MCALVRTSRHVSARQRSIVRLYGVHENANGACPNFYLQRNHRGTDYLFVGHHNPAFKAFKIVYEVPGEKVC